MTQHIHTIETMDPPVRHELPLRTMGKRARKPNGQFYAREELDALEAAGTPVRDAVTPVVEAVAPMVPNIPFDIPPSPAYTDDGEVAVSAAPVVAAAPTPTALPVVDGFKTVRVWTAGPGTPQDGIYVPETGKKIKPGPDFAYYCRTPDELAAVKKGLGPGRWWPDNIAEDEPSLTCQTCHWTSRNYRAMEWHTNNAHGREQTVG